MVNLASNPRKTANFSSNKSTKAFIANPNKPTVKNRIGKVTRFNNGLTTLFKTPKSKANDANPIQVASIWNFPWKYGSIKVLKFSLKYQKSKELKMTERIIFL